MRLAAGSALGPYQITGPIGAGGMGEVYRARDTRLGREVAIKILPREVAADPERLARFEREARSASALNHPNIVTIHDFASRDAETWLVMELIRGESLRDLLERGPVPPRKLFGIAAGIADGLATAHAAGIVHRDLKPENVMLTGDGVPKILDFGLVKQVAAADLTDSPTEQQVSRDGVTLGTATYMSPEQARGQALDFRSDQFALGLILREMATGKHPFRRPSSFETLTAIANEEPPPLPDSFPEPFVWMVERCLAKNPAERYGSTADLARDLARLRDRPSSGTGLRPLPAPAVRIPWQILAGAVVVIGALLLMLTLRRTPAGIRDPFQVDIATPQVVTVGLGEVLLPVAISPDGRYLVVNGAGASGKSELWLHDLQSGAARLIAEDAFAPAWSSDSRSIAFFADGKLKTVPVEGGPARIVCDGRPEGTPTWQGDTILFTQYSTAPGLYRVSASGGVPTLLVGSGEKPQYTRPFWPQLLPDGKRYLYMRLHPGNVYTQQITHEIRIASLDGKSDKLIPGVTSRAVYVDGRLLFVRDGTLLAQRFDPDEARLSGDAEPLIGDLHYFRSTGHAAFSVSQNGIVAWRSPRPRSRLVWMDRGGMELESIATGTFDTAGRLSADGKRYVVGVIDPRQGVSDIWIYDLERRSEERVTFQPADEKEPVWGRDGRTIYYRSDGGGGPPDIFKIAAGEDRGTLLHAGPVIEEPKDVSPDGKWLLMVNHYQASSDILVLPLDPPGKPRPFATTPFNETSPRFSPDGRLVAYSSDQSGRPEIYVRPFEGPAPAARISNEGGTRPRWRRDGRELYYLGPDGRIMSVPFDGTFGAPRLLFQATDTADFEPAPDGSRFLMQLQERSAATPVHLLINWPSRLRK
ncbi:MAG TPA: protein kinase [Thermoanaerobaculia bacterium]|nr:protein kinase [Thermoanaerobaculia bacterium]